MQQQLEWAAWTDSIFYRHFSDDSTLKSIVYPISALYPFLRAHIYEQIRIKLQSLGFKFSLFFIVSHQRSSIFKLILLLAYAPLNFTLFNTTAISQMALHLQAFCCFDFDACLNLNLMVAVEMDFSLVALQVVSVR